ncbi:MAG: TnsD family Tn7-like transposition protein [Kovacikia sp.]
MEVEQLGLRETARRLQVDPRTINRYVERFGLSPKWRSQTEMQESASTDLPCSQFDESGDLRSKHRTTWNTLQKASKTALRRLAPATYSWLYRYDRDWLDQNSPSAQKPVYINNRVNWQKRDEQILAQVKEAVQVLLSAEKPIRITVSRVAKAIGQLALIEQHLDQMPQTKAYLDSVTESIEDYQIRRVR